MANDENASGESKISESSTAIVIALILFFPLGLYWMWKYPNWPTGNKWAVTGGIAVVALIGALTDDGKQTEPDTDASTTVTEQSVAKETPVAQPDENSIGEKPARSSYEAKKSGGVFGKDKSITFDLAPMISREVVLKDFKWDQDLSTLAVISFKLTWHDSLNPGKRWSYTVYDSDGAKLRTAALIVPTMRVGDTIKTSVNVPEGGSRVFIHY